MPKTTPRRPNSPKIRRALRYVHVAIIPVEVRDPKLNVLVERIVLNHNFRRARGLKRAPGDKTYNVGRNFAKRLDRQADIRDRVAARSVRA